ncbi:hypothetical protein PF010_g28801, partial [Phytophthora fragariae]
TQSKEGLAQLSSALRHQEKKFQNAKPASSSLHDELADTRCMRSTRVYCTVVGRIWQCACGAGAMWSKAWQRPLHRAAYASSTPSPEPVAPASAEPVPIERVTGRDEGRPRLPFQLAAGELGKVPDPGGPCQLLGLLGPLRLY